MSIIFCFWTISPNYTNYSHIYSYNEGKSNFDAFGAGCEKGSVGRENVGVYVYVQVYVSSFTSVGEFIGTCFLH